MPLKLHLGCGPKDFGPEWTHIDVMWYPHLTYCGYIDKLTMIADSTVDLIYSCHTLEHFMRKQVPGVLAEWHRVLKPGGVLRLSVPDFWRLASYYLQHGRLDEVRGPLFGGQTYLYNFHHAVFDRATLTRLLLVQGFDLIHEYDWRETEHAHIDDFSQAHLPHVPRDPVTGKFPDIYYEGTQISLNLEATKL